MLKIVKAAEPMPVEQLVIVLYGPPGLGKSTLAFTGDAPLLFDCDKGAYRAANRKDTVSAPNWKAIETISPKELDPYKLVVLDTAGRALDMLIADIIAENPKWGRGANPTMQGWGELKSRFGRYLKMLKTYGKDLVLICHMDEQRNGDDVIERLDVQGGSKGEIYKSADAMGRIIIRNGERFIDFNPRENSFGKNPCGLPITPFSLDDKTCLADIIRTIKDRLNASGAKPAQEASGHTKHAPATVDAPTQSAPAKSNGHKPNGNGPASHIVGVAEKIIARGPDKKPLKTKTGTPFVKVIVQGTQYFAFDNAERVIIDSEHKEQRLRLFGLLAEAKPQTAIDFIYTVDETDKGVLRKIQEVTRIGLYEWEAGTGIPVDQRGAQGNPEISDSDIPF